MVQKAFSGRRHVVRGVTGAQWFKRGPLFTLDPPPLNISDPDGFHRWWCIGELLLGKVERWHGNDPFPQPLEGNALLDFLDEHFVQQGTEIPGDWEAFPPKCVGVGAIAIVVRVSDGFPGTVTSDKGEEDHAEGPHVGGLCGEGSGIAGTMCITFLIEVS